MGRELPVRPAVAGRGNALFPVPQTDFDGVSDLAVRRAWLLLVVQWNLHADRTGKIAFTGAFTRIARDIQDSLRTAMTGQAIL